MNDTTTPDTTTPDVAQLLAEIRALRDQLTGVRAELADLRAERITHQASITTSIEDVPTSRRRLFALAGGAAAAAVTATAIGGATPAAATSGGSFQIDRPNEATGVTVGTELNYTGTIHPGSTNFLTVHDGGAFQNGFSQYSAAVAGWSFERVNNGVYGYVDDGGPNTAGVVGWAASDQASVGVRAIADGVAAPGVLATSTNTTSGFGVKALAVGTTGIAVAGESTTYIDLAAQGTGRLYLKANVTAGPPTAGTYLTGEVVTDAAGDVFVCFAGGTPGSWRKLGGGTTAGAFHAIDPTRVHDSRLPAAAGVLATNASRQIRIADAIDTTTGAVKTADIVPAGTTAIAYNLTIAEATLGGFLAVTPGTATSFTASTINWSPGTTSVANGTVVKIAADRTVKVFCGGGGATQFVIDVVGYYR
jgi:hypothetical protein